LTRTEPRGLTQLLPDHAVLRHDDLMQPNLARIPGDGDARAQAILRRAPGAVSQALLKTLDDRAYHGQPDQPHRHPMVNVSRRAGACRCDRLWRPAGIPH